MESDVGFLCDFIAGIEPGSGAAGDVEQVGETELLQDAGGRARSITAGADHCGCFRTAQTKCGRRLS